MKLFCLLVMSETRNWMHRMLNQQQQQQQTNNNGDYDGGDDDDEASKTITLEMKHELRVKMSPKSQRMAGTEFEMN